MRQKGLIAVLAALGAAAGCGGEEPAALRICAAASLTETAAAAAALYERSRPGVRTELTLDSSGTLGRQIGEGAACDVFIAAAPGPVDELERKGLIAPGTRVDLLENKAALVVPPGSAGEKLTFANLKESFAGECRVPFAIGNADVPAGRYALGIFRSLGIDADELASRGCLSYGASVREVAAQVAEGMARGGIVYATDAKAAGLPVADLAPAELSGRVVYPAAAPRGGDVARAKDFIGFLRSEEAARIFADAGFVPLGPAPRE